MKQFIRRLSRVADTSSQYRLLRSDTSTPTRRTESFHVAVSSSKKPGRLSVPEGHVPVYVGEEMERFAVSAELLNHPVFVGLLNKSAQEYGYEQKGVLHIPCHVLVFERVMEALRLGVESHDLEDLLRSFPGDFFFDF
ncbi:Auxin-responsive protein SAUR41 [Hibiscus syriacus]|uniref:Auxin-responsive protein SAUR41 n=1 Tax=Hibiscus syriacus TaxID=106335 RepID=A0A6A3ATF6_HIBSY|nr:auxin-responsive protein SAUR72-like [Hibiscus syriacus]KAE8706385.1 Auxin-responsive protein SAUR41 [Hibiscus syriacus]